jgi:hypothetical protein
MREDPLRPSVEATRVDRHVVAERTERAPAFPDHVAHDEHGDGRAPPEPAADLQGAKVAAGRAEIRLPKAEVGAR